MEPDYLLVGQIFMAIVNRGKYISTQGDNHINVQIADCKEALELRATSILRVYYKETCIGTLGRTNTRSSVRSVVRIKVENKGYMESTTTTRGAPR